MQFKYQARNVIKQNNLQKRKKTNKNICITYIQNICIYTQSLWPHVNTPDLLVKDHDS